MIALRSVDLFRMLDSAESRGHGLGFFGIVGYWYSSTQRPRTNDRTTERPNRLEVMSEPKHNTQRCQLCGRADCPGHNPADIPILKGHVRRAIRAADAVCAAAAGEEGQEPGMVLMTALLLVERLANAQGCEPAAVLQKMADSFETKRRATATLSHSN